MQRRSLISLNEHEHHNKNTTIGIPRLNDK